MQAQQQSTFDARFNEKDSLLEEFTAALSAFEPSGSSNGAEWGPMFMEAVEQLIIILQRFNIKTPAVLAEPSVRATVAAIQTAEANNKFLPVMIGLCPRLKP